MIKTILKLTFALGITYWLVSSGKLDFNLVKSLFDYKIQLLIAFLLIILQVVIASLRWRMLLRTQISKPISIIQNIKLTWIGLFFSTVLPGSITGDLVKMVYARDLDQDKPKSFFFMSILIDRIIGLIGLVFLMGIMSLYSYNEISAISPKLQSMIHFNFLFFIGITIFFLTLFLPYKAQSYLLKCFVKIPKLGHKFSNIFQQYWTIGKNKVVILKTLLLSIFAHSLAVTAFWYLTQPFISEPIPLKYAFSFVPLGFVSIAIPIAPAGLGVGHAAFDVLFSFFNINNGASLFNLFFIVMVTNNLLGIFAYLTSTTKYSTSKLEQVEETLQQAEK
ncbi:MAG: flippase-like domain-containing protein [Bdellovibrionales bacterium]|nr:flippase-like domain-containing protein [Bdellovibrionales bacterium]